jgi:glycosyltransferase involved in cell wall biosynthesis
MKVAVLNNAVPFVRGGAELLAEKLVVEIERAGHDAELVSIPFQWEPPTAVVDSMLATGLMRLEAYDRVVALKFPTYLVPHDDVVIWLLHQFRQVYDLWGLPAGWPENAETRDVRELVRRADVAAIGSATRVFCNSTVTQDRLRMFCGLKAEVLLPPLLQDQEFRRGDYGTTLVALGRISDAKRQELAVRAMAQLPDDVPGRLVVAGPPDTPEDADRLRDAVRTLGLGDRVEVIAEFISDERKRDLLADARAVVYLPVDEDSFGYVTLEAAHSARPVVTVTDSGGILTLVEDQRTGLVAEPEPAALAAAFRALLTDSDRARRLGNALRERADSWDLDWPTVVRRLLS